MGYGGAVENSGTVTQYSKDGGIDGEIKEDILGFGRIYIQAKRYKKDSTIGRPEIQGMQTEQTFSIKKLDTDFWDSLLNDDVQSSIT